MKLVVLGLSITSSWGNGHATTYRALLRGFAALGHEVYFLERDRPWYAAHRDLAVAGYARTLIYDSLGELASKYAALIRAADAVMVGSYVPEGPAVIDFILRQAGGLRAFYDIDTPVTIAALRQGGCQYLRRDQVPAFDLYLSFTGGGTLDRLEREFGASAARALYCSVDTEHYYPEPVEPRFDLGYLGTYSEDRQPALERLLLEPARALPERRFAVIGPQYPADVRWPSNVYRRSHLEPSRHRSFYCSQRVTLNVTRARMREAGWSPSVRLFEAAACGVPIVSDSWEGLDRFFEPGYELLVVEQPEEVISLLREMGPDDLRRIGARARRKVLAEHSARVRGKQLEGYLQDARVTAGRSGGRSNAISLPWPSALSV